MAGEQYLANLKIPASDITAGTSANGKVYITIYKDESLRFDEVNCEALYCLPIKDVQINASNLPKEVVIKGYDGKIESKIKVEYVFQKIEDIPIQVKQPLERTKPWGTGQALLTSASAVDDVFMIINADDFYGRDAFLTLGEFLKNNSWKTDKKKHYALVAYQLSNTLSQNGTVSRGICEVKNEYLEKITERTKIGYINNKLVYLEGENSTPIDKNSLVSTNLFGFTPKIFEDAEHYFEEFLKNEQDLTTKEFYLPTIVQKSIDDNLADVSILTTTSKFNGMTYQEDLKGLKENIKELIEAGVYPDNLWEEKHEK